MVNIPASQGQKSTKLGRTCYNVSTVCCSEEDLSLGLLDNNIRVSDDWVERWGRKHEAVKLPDGGYLGMLSVFHELHCIVRSN